MASEKPSTRKKENDDYDDDGYYDISCIVPIEDRPTDFTARRLIAFMHQAEYNTSLGCAYIDECDHTTTPNSTERKLVLAANRELWTRKSKEANELRESLLMQRPSYFQHVNFFATMRGSIFDFSVITSEFNGEQRAAFTGLFKLPAKVVALEGPPGTGKTLWATRVLLPLVQCKNDTTGRKHQILAVAATKEQADKLYMQTTKTFGAKMRQDKMPSVVLLLSRSYVEASIQNADVVVTTPSAACQFWTRGSFKPSHIIIDGASQIMEPVLWPILALAANTANFVAMILIGDDMQVPRLVTPDSEKCKFKVQLEISLFRRLIISGLCLLSLREQRRMHGDIAACPKHVFYGYSLSTHMDEKWNKLSYCIRRFNAECFRMTSNMLVIDSPDGKQKVDDSGSSVNEKNAQLVVSLVTRLRTMLRSDLDASSITILTFYNAQKQLHERNMRLLQHEKPELNADKVIVSTVDSFEGHEANVVILDFVVVDRPGFVTDKARLISALTRAKSGLYVIASMDGIGKACAEMSGHKGKDLESVLTDWQVREIVSSNSGL